MKTFKNGLLFINFILKVRAVNREKGSYHRYANNIAKHEVSRSHKLNDGSIQRLHYLKIQWYMATNLYLGELLVELRPHDLTLKEKKSLIYLGALMAITDLMVDDFQIASEKVSLLMKETNEEYDSHSAIEKIFLLYHEQLLSNIGPENRHYIKDFSMRKPHIESQFQLKKSISETEILELTERKGGTAVLLTASLLLEITERNEKAFYQLGAFIQYLNDSQDKYKDVKAGVTTFVNFYNTFDDINEKLKQEFDKTIRLLYLTKYPSDGLYRLVFYLHAMYVGVIYKNVEFAKITGNRIDIKKIYLMDKSKFNINMLSIKSLLFCTPRIVRGSDFSIQ